jgi:transposase
MRGEDTQNQTLFSYVRTDDRIPSNHPLRLIRQIADAALAALSGQFDAVYAAEGRPSIPPERLLRALLIQAFYSVRSERQLMEQLNYNLLFRWFVGLSVDDPVWDPSTFSKNRERVLNEDFAACFLDAVLNADKVKGLVSSEHFSVDGTLIQAWASMKSFRRKDGKDQPPSGAMASETSIRKSPPMRRTPRRRTRTPGCIKRGVARRRNLALSATSLWRTAAD